MIRTHSTKDRVRLLKDGLLLIFSILLALLIVQTNAVHAVERALHEFTYVVIFIAGIFFTSVFTTAPSIAILGELAQQHPPWIIALLGGLGAMCGDVVLFHFIHDRVTKDLRILMQLPPARRARSIFGTILPRALWPLLGAVIIASPLPDEIGIVLMGLSKMNQRLFLPLSFILNSAGIFLICITANALR